MIKGYADKKSKGNAAITKNGDDIIYTKKVYDSETGDALPDRTMTITRSQLVNEKSQIQKEIDALESRMADIDAAIIDIDAL